jgi:hypothetical protein
METAACASDNLALYLLVAVPRMFRRRRVVGGVPRHPRLSYLNAYKLVRKNGDDP